MTPARLIAAAVAVVALLVWLDVGLLYQACAACVVVPSVCSALGGGV